jgi:hypothetical protein
MADQKEAAKPTPSDEFRKSLKNKDAFKATITEGLKHKSGKIRSLAVKAAFKLKDHGFIKQNILSLIKSDKSKKVLRAISGKITRRDLVKKVKAARVKKTAGKSAATTDAAEAPAATPKA